MLVWRSFLSLSAAAAADLGCSAALSGVDHMKSRRGATTAFYLIVVQGCVQQPANPSAAPEDPKATTTFAASLPVTSDKSAPYAYDNKVNRLAERRLAVTDNHGKPAARGNGGPAIGDVDLKIVWTGTHQFSWNYVLPEFPGGKKAFESEYPSESLFLKRKVEAKTILEVLVPDTPYSFFIINGEPSPYFEDSEKWVIWQVNGLELEKAFREMRSISVSSKTIKFIAGGGDMRAFIEVDFSDRQTSPKVKYWEVYDGF
jgi:hypothetical protein